MRKKPCKYCDIEVAETKTGIVRICESDRYTIWEFRKGDKYRDEVPRSGFYLEEYEGWIPIRYCPNCGRKLEAQYVK